MTNHCPQLDQLPEHARTFWEEKQRETGEQLQKFSYAVLVEPIRFPAREKSGIVYVMTSSVWFEDFPKPPVFFLNKASTYTKTCIRIPRSDISAVELAKQSSFEARFFGRQPSSGWFQNILGIFNPDPTYLIMTVSQKTGEPLHYILRDLDDPTAWVQTLQTP